MKSTTPRKSLPLKDWPADDHARWLACRSLSRSRRSRVDPASWSKATLASAECVWGYYLAFLKSEKTLDAAAPLVMRIDEGAVVRFANFRSETTSLSSVAMQLNGLVMFVRAVTGSKPPAWLRDFKLNLDERARLEHRERPEPPSPAQLALVGFDILEQAQNIGSETPLQAAAMFRDGLMIALTAFHGNRRRELVEIQAERNLLRTTDGYMLLLDKSNTKNKKSDRIRLNPLLTAAFDEYLAVHRPALVDAFFASRGKTCEALFVSARCGHLHDTRVSNIFSQWTEKLLGSAWSPHAFRRAITTDAVKRDPKLVACAAAVNRHSMKVAHAHYNMAKVSAAERRFAEIFRLAST